MINTLISIQGDGINCPRDLSLMPLETMSQSKDWPALMVERHQGTDDAKKWFPPHVEKFLPAIVDIERAESAVQRHPEWYALRCVAGQERNLLWFLDRIKMPVRYLYFIQKIKRHRSIKRSYLPGYLFLHFDAAIDRWQQITRMPYALEYLGKPTPIHDATFDDLCRRCPERLGKPSELAAVALGTMIRIKRGALAGHKAVVIWSDRKHVKVPVLIFGSRDVEVTLKVADIEVVNE